MKASGAFHHSLRMAPFVKIEGVSALPPKADIFSDDVHVR
jgi:hypothetical protein